MPITVRRGLSQIVMQVLHAQRITFQRSEKLLFSSPRIVAETLRAQNLSSPTLIKTRARQGDSRGV